MGDPTTQPTTSPSMGSALSEAPNNNKSSNGPIHSILNEPVPLKYVIGICLLLIFFSCICCYYYRRRLIKKYIPKHYKTRTESLSEPIPQRKGSNDSDFDVLPLTETLTIGNCKSETI